MENRIRKIEQIPTLAIKPDPNQPRKDFDSAALIELAESIRRNGLLQPIAIRKNGHGYIIIMRTGQREFG